jgi:hypothetical protein
VEFSRSYTPKAYYTDPLVATAGKSGGYGGRNIRLASLDPGIEEGRSYNRNFEAMNLNFLPHYTNNPTRSGRGNANRPDKSVWHHRNVFAWMFPLVFLKICDQPVFLLVLETFTFAHAVEGSS